VGWEKVSCWRTKAAISLKRAKIEETLVWMAYRNSPTLSRTVPSPTPYGLLFPTIGVSNPPKTPIDIISGMGEASVFKFGRNIHKVNPKKRLLKILQQRKRRHIQRLPIWGEGYSQLSQERVKLRTSHFVRILIASIGRKVY